MSRTNYGIKAVAHILSICAVAWAQAPSEPVPAGAPIVEEGRTLFAVQASLGPFTAQERAEAASKRLTGISKDLTASVDAITTVTSDTSTDITLGDRVLLTVTDRDAAAIGKNRAESVAADIASVRFAITAVRAEYS